MYLEHFGLAFPPFRLACESALFFRGGERGAVLDTLVMAIQDGEACIKVVGDAGSGKSMLCHMLTQRLPENAQAVSLPRPEVEPHDLVHTIASALNLPATKTNERLEVLQRLHDHLRAQQAAGRPVVVLVDDAQNVPVATLEELRLLSRSDASHRQLLQIVLFGRPELDANLAKSGIRQLSHCITHNFVLGPLASDEVRDYLLFRLYAAGLRRPDLFTAAALSRIGRVTGGMPGPINVIAYKALLAADAEGAKSIDLPHVRVAEADAEFQRRDQGWNWRYAAAAVALLVMGAAGALLLQRALTPASVPALPVAQEAVAPRSALTEPATPPALVAAPEASQPQPVAPGVSAVPAPAAAAPTPAVEPAAAATAAVVAEPALPAAASAATGPEPVETLDAALGPVNHLLTQRIEATEQWLQQVDHHAYTIQLLTLERPGGALAAFLAEAERLKQEDNIYIYRARYGDKLRWGVLYGEFTGYTPAHEAVAQLPPLFQSYKPYVRGVKAVIKEVGVQR